MNSNITFHFSVDTPFGFLFARSFSDDFGGFVKILVIVFIFLLAPAAQFVQAEEAWRSIGPWGGLVREDYWDISEDGSTIVVPADRQLFISHNQGVTWHTEPVDLLLYDSIDRLQLVRVVDVDVLVSTTRLGSEILISGNLGKVWERKRIPEICLQDVPVAPAVLARGGSFLELIVISEGGTCRTVDRGANWQIVDTSDTHSGDTPAILFANPERPDVIYSKGLGGSLSVYTDNGNAWSASSAHREVAVDPFDSARLLAVDPLGRVSRSLNYGLTFEYFVQIPKPEVLFVASGIVFDPEKKDRVYVFGSTEYLHVSEDGGETWALKLLEGETTRYGRIDEMRFLPGVRNKVLVATSQGGFGLLDLDSLHIRPLNHGYSNFRVSALDHFDQGELEMTVGTYGGAVYQYDDAFTWSKHQHLIMNIEDVLIDWAGTGSVLVAGSGTLLWQNPADGQWKVQAQGDWNLSSSYQADESVPGRYLGSVNHSIFESLDYGATGKVIIETPSSVGDAFFFNSDPERIVVTGRGGGALSLDGGATWDITKVPQVERYKGAHQSRIDERRLWMPGPAYEGYVESRDAGTSWITRLEIEDATSHYEVGERAVRRDERSMSVNRIVTDPADDNHLFLLGSYIGYAESRDDGNTWTLVPLPYEILNYSMKNGGTRPEDAYLGTSGGVMSHEPVVALAVSITARTETEMGLDLDLEIRNTGSDTARDVHLLWNAYADAALEQESSCQDLVLMEGISRCRFGDLMAGERAVASVKLNAGEEQVVEFYAGATSRDAISNVAAASVSATKKIPDPEPEPGPQPDAGVEQAGGGASHPIWLLMCSLAALFRRVGKKESAPFV